MGSNQARVKRYRQKVGSFWPLQTPVVGVAGGLTPTCTVGTGEGTGSAVVGEVEGKTVGPEGIGEPVGAAVGSEMVGEVDGDAVGPEVVGEIDGDAVGAEVDGEDVGDVVGFEKGEREGEGVGSDVVGEIVGRVVGSEKVGGVLWTAWKTEGRLYVLIIFNNKKRVEVNEAKEYDQGCIKAGSGKAGRRLWEK